MHASRGERELVAAVRVLTVTGYPFPPLARARPDHRGRETTLRDCHSGCAECEAMEATSLRFAQAARTLAGVARREGLQVPAFRSPPSIDGVQRTLRRRRGAATVAVRLRQRPWAAVVADMIEGIVVTNRLSGADADAVRAALWSALDVDHAQVAA
jgi:hypothetical protein